MSQWIKFLLLIACMVLGLAFHLRNDQLVPLDYLLGRTDFYFSLWLLAALAIGAVLGFLASLPSIIRLKQHNSRLTRQLRGIETEISNRSSSPVKDS